MHRQPPELLIRLGRFEVGIDAILKAAVGELGRVEQIAVADGHLLDLLLGGVATDLGQGSFNRAPIPGQGAWSFELDDEVLHALRRQEGNLGLIRAVEKFDYRKGYELGQVSRPAAFQSAATMASLGHESTHVPQSVQSAGSMT